MGRIPSGEINNSLNLLSEYSQNVITETLWTHCQGGIFRDPKKARCYNPEVVVVRFRDPNTRHNTAWWSKGINKENES